MAFWSDNRTLEPFRQHRWYIQFNNTGVTDLSGVRYAVKKMDKPKAKIGEVTHKYMNHFFYYPGRLEWEAVNLTLASVRGPDVDSTIMATLQQAGYIVPAGNTSAEQYTTIGKASFTAAIGELQLIQVDPIGSDAEIWTLVRPFFTSVQFGSLDYANEDIVEVSLTIRYDYATHSLPGQSTAIPVFT